MKLKINFEYIFCEEIREKKIIKKIINLNKKKI